MNLFATSSTGVMMVMVAAVIAASWCDAAGLSNGGKMWQFKTYTATNVTFPNPGRGFYGTTNPPYGAGISATDIDTWEARETNWTPALVASDLIHDRVERNITVHLVRYSLAAFRTSDLSDEIVKHIEQDFATSRQARVKLGLQFVYGWTDGRPDAEAGRILRHTSRLKPVLARNADMLDHVRAGFVGQYGEWHDSTHGLLAGPLQRSVGPSARNILDAIFDMTPKDRMVTIRYPQQKSQYFHKTAGEAWRDFTPMPEQGDAFSGSRESRAGNDNDSLFWNTLDEGNVYGYDATDAWGFGGVSQPAAEVQRMRERVALENRFVLQVGELDTSLGDTMTYSNCSNAIQELSSLRWSLLNIKDGSSEDDESVVISKWRKEGCFTTIANKLGYRFELLRARLPASILLLNDANTVSLGGSVTLRNVGWATPLHPRDLALVLRNTASSKAYSISILKARHPIFDPRLWTPERGEIEVAFSTIPLSARLEVGTYEVLIHLPDPDPALRGLPDFAIRFANEQIWEPETGYNSLNTVIDVQSSVQA